MWTALSPKKIDAFRAKKTKVELKFAKTFNHLRETQLKTKIPFAGLYYL